jgi:hypothetical protein
VPTNPTIADLLSAQARAWVYAILGILNAIWLGLAPVLAATVDSVWGVAIPAIILGVANAAGFTLSRANVPVATNTAVRGRAA